MDVIRAVRFIDTYSSFAAGAKANKKRHITTDSQTASFFRWKNSL
jgi:hypothetical protein